MINHAAALLHNAGVENPRLDAELLLARAAGATRVRVLTDDLALTDAVRADYSALLNRRAAREPLAYILGRKEFYSLELEVTPAVLIPRPETETVVSAALAAIEGRPARVLDLGTGSGAIAIAIAANATQAIVVASDISDAALVIARRNAARLSLAPRITFRRADCLTPLDGGPPLGRFDLVVSNPPYISDAELAALQPEIARWEPRIALAGGPDGLDFYRRMTGWLGVALSAAGRLIVEIGERQASAVGETLEAAGFRVSARLTDYAGRERAVVAAR